MSDLGVLVMRVQVDDLHEGHFDTISEVVSRHDRTLIVIGLSPCKCTVNNPLDFNTRRLMLINHFPSVMIAYIEDMYSDKLWSEKLDSIIKSKSRPNDDVCLYGSRDSFIPHYHGEFNTKTLDQRVHISGTIVRKNLALQSRNTKDFRAGAIWFALNQYPSAIPTVDIAVIDDNRILLGKKPNEDKFRIIGGFVQPGETYEDAATRELEEETGIKAGSLTPVKSFFIDDWRYRNETNKITTFLYICFDYSGRIRPDDDIEECQWFDINDGLKDEVIPHHSEMIEYITNNIEVLR